MRDRDGDLRLLIDHFLARYSRQMGKKVMRIDPEAMQALENYDWPGNVRELESMLKQALINATGTVITPDCLPEIRCFHEGPATAAAVTTKRDQDTGVYARAGRTDAPPRPGGIRRATHRGEQRGLHAETLEMMERYC